MLMDGSSVGRRYDAIFNMEMVDVGSTGADRIFEEDIMVDL